MSFFADPGLPSDAARVADQQAIEALLANHSRGVDRADAATLKHCYWPDATVAYGGFNGSAHEFCELLPGAIRTYRATQHCLSNCLVSFGQDAKANEARSECYVTAYHYREGPDQADEEMVFFGRYLDRLLRREGRWKIAHRTVVMDWNRTTPARSTESGPPFEGLTRGARYPEDPLVAHLNDSTGNPS